MATKLHSFTASTIEQFEARANALNNCTMQLAEKDEHTRNLLQFVYLDYLNNFSTIEVCADHYGVSEWVMNTVVTVGRKIHLERTNKTKHTNKR